MVETGKISKTPRTPRRKRQPSLEDVAGKAGVSTATVSRCLNEPEKVSQETLERVMKVVKGLHYAPNFGARAIAANRTGTIGAIVPTMENAIFARGLEAFQKVLVENRQTLLVANSSYDLEREAEQIRTLVARGADGLLLIGTDRDPQTYDFLECREVPAVIAWARSDNPSHSYVGFDSFASSLSLAKLAIEKGHRRFAFISAYTKMNDRARNRVAGTRKALKEAGFDPQEMPVIETLYSVNCGREAFNQLMADSPRPTVVFCGNDVLAVGAVQGALDAGMKIPEDIAITGFDDIELARIVRPALTTVHVPHREMGRVSAESLLALLAGEEGPVRIDLQTSIIERGSL